MGRRPKDPLRPLKPDERTFLEDVARARSLPWYQVSRAKALLAVDAGKSFTQAAHEVGLKLGDSVGQWVSRFNAEGLEALEPRHGGGAPALYGSAQRQRILQEFTRTPDRVRDGTATWSLETLKRALRQAEDGLPEVSSYTIWCTLREAGYTWQADRSWCPTGKVLRRRKAGLVEVSDPDAAPKKT